MAFISIICINPQNQNEKVKANINHLINGIISLVKQFKSKSTDKNQEKEEENVEEELDDENENKFNVKEFSFLFLFKNYNLV